jgi:hypothetical protein
MAKKSSEKADKPAKTRKGKSTTEIASGDASAAPSPVSKRELRANTKAEKKAAKSGLVNSTSGTEDELETSELLPSLPKEKRLKGPLLNLAVITFFFAIVISLVSILLPFKDVVSVSSDVIGTFSVEVTISTPQFISAPAVNACEGSGRLSGLSNAILRMEAKDGSWKVNSPLGTGQINSAGECVYTPEIETPESFDGGSVRARVDFDFGSSETFNVDGNSIKLKIDLGI